VNLNSLKKLLVGSPLATAQAHHERLSKTSALAVFSSDALSSVAYATEEILLILVLAGTVALHYSIPIGIAIAVLIAVVVSSYRQTILAYPLGGGSYIVTKDNLGTLPGLISGGALLIDYVLTVAVSVAAGVAALTSAVPWLYPYRIVIGVVFVALVTLANLRGIRESGKLFALPTYLFIAGFCVLIVYGLVRWTFGWDAPAQAVRPVIPGGQELTLFLVLRAFASGCAALTGVEAVSDGVQAFKRPEGEKRARRAGVARRHPDFALHGHHVPHAALRLDAAPRGDHRLPAGAPDRRRGPLLLRAAGLDHAHPGAGGQHRLRRLSAAVLLPRPGWLPAAPVRHAG
jgi:hypothetical protein